MTNLKPSASVFF